MSNFARTRNEYSSARRWTELEAVVAGFHIEYIDGPTSADESGGKQPVSVYSASAVETTLHRHLIAVETRYLVGEVLGQASYSVRRGLSVDQSCDPERGVAACWYQTVATRHVNWVGLALAGCR